MSAWGRKLIERGNYENNSGVIVNGVLNKEIDNVIRELKNLGYKEYKNNWNSKVDTYKQIKKTGL